jgi:hypothetical protein
MWKKDDVLAIEQEGRINEKVKKHFKDNVDFLKKQMEEK